MSVTQRQWERWRENSGKTVNKFTWVHFASLSLSLFSSGCMSDAFFFSLSLPVCVVCASPPLEFTGKVEPQSIFVSLAAQEDSKSWGEVEREACRTLALWPWPSEREREKGRRVNEDPVDEKLHITWHHVSSNLGQLQLQVDTRKREREKEKKRKRERERKLTEPRKLRKREPKRQTRTAHRTKDSRQRVRANTSGSFKLVC